MKKIVSVLIILCMAFSMTVSAADRVVASASKIQTLMNALEIMQGDENGNFNLGNNVTRAEFAKIMVAASSHRADVSSVSRVSPFADVPYTHWGAPYIKTASSYNLIKGYSDSTFKPENTVLLEEGVTVALKILGYSDSDFTASWPSGQLKLAKNLKLLDNLDTPLQGTGMTRHDVMYLVFNTLNTNLKGSNTKAINSVFGYNLTSAGDIEDIVMDNGDIEGPVTITGSNLSSVISAMPTSAKYYKDDKTASASDISVNDLVYYSDKMNTVWIYSEKIFGVYENATPSKNNLNSVTVSGVSYSIEETKAYDKLATGGEFEYGDSVLLLIGKGGGVADVISADGQTQISYGYVTACGSKEYQYTTGEKYTSYYVKVMSADAKEYEYKTNMDYSSYLSSVCSVKFSGDNAILTKMGLSTLVGEVSLKDSKIGTTLVSSNVKILDVGTVDKSKTPVAVQTYLPRIDGANLSRGDVLFYTTDSNSKIDTLFLSNVTGDAYKYGVVTDVTIQKTSSGSSMTTGFTMDINGNKYSVNSVRRDVKVGDVLKVTLNRGAIDEIYALTKVNQSINNIDYGYVYTSSKTYPVSEDVVVYKKYYVNNGYEYKIIPISDIIGTNLKKSVAYVSSSAFDKVRIIIVE